jgi:polysaccharide pyruvyl transferase WcaK-like protein
MSPGVYQITAEDILRGGETLHSEIKKLVMHIWNKEGLRQQWKQTIVVPIHKNRDKTDCSNYRGTSLFSTSYTNLSNILLSNSFLMQMKLLVNTKVEFY